MKPAGRPRILIVDDTPANIDVLVGLLKADYELKVANRGAKALQICEADPLIDAILLDIMMPEMDGFEVCRQLRQHPIHRHTPVIFLTARTEAEDVVRGFEIGANDYVTKPFRPTELIARVRTQLMVQSQQREIAARNSELKEMLQIVGHDVANQFAVAQLALEIIRDHPGEDQRWLARIAAAVRNGIGLTRLVSEMRRSEDKQLRLEPVSLLEVVTEALMLVEDRSRSKQLTVQTELPPLTVMAERCSLVNSVLTNLLTNAIKFSHPGGKIMVAARAEGDRAVVTIRDEGIGMPPETVAKLFDLGKSHSRTGTAGETGTGFGMPLMRKFVGIYGGDVSVTSRDIATHPADHGTEFTLRFRLAPA